MQTHYPSENDNRLGVRDERTRGSETESTMATGSRLECLLCNFKWINRTTSHLVGYQSAVSYRILVDFFFVCCFTRREEVEIERERENDEKRLCVVVDD